MRVSYGRRDKNQTYSSNYRQISLCVSCACGVQRSFSLPRKRYFGHGQREDGVLLTQPATYPNLGNPCACIWAKQGGDICPCLRYHVHEHSFVLPDRAGCYQWLMPVACGSIKSTVKARAGQLMQSRGHKYEQQIEYCKLASLGVVSNNKQTNNRQANSPSIRFENLTHTPRVSL